MFPWEIVFLGLLKDLKRGEMIQLQEKGPNHSRRIGVERAIKTSGKNIKYFLRHDEEGKAIWLFYKASAKRGKKEKAKP